MGRTGSTANSTPRSSKGKTDGYRDLPLLHRYIREAETQEGGDGLMQSLQHDADRWVCTCGCVLPETLLVCPWCWRDRLPAAPTPAAEGGAQHLPSSQSLGANEECE